MQVGDVRVFGGIWRFLKEEKVYWITPVVLLLLIMVILILLTDSSATLPYEYTLP